MDAVGTKVTLDPPLDILAQSGLVEIKSLKDFVDLPQYSQL